MDSIGNEAHIVPQIIHKSIGDALQSATLMGPIMQQNEKSII
jgi:hypothetical protein